MCFGPVASFTASAVLASIGTAVIRNIRSKKEILFAAFPILFALQQFTEGLLWLVIKNQKHGALEKGLTFAFLVFAYSFWPILCPASVYAIEYDQNQRKILRRLILLGIGTSAYLFFYIIKNPFYATVLNCSIRYKTFVAWAPIFTGIYLIVTLLPYFISSHRSILIFGLPNLIFCVIAYFFYEVTFISTWCFFAAVISLNLYFFLRKLHHKPIIPIPKTIEKMIKAI